MIYRGVQFALVGHCDSLFPTPVGSNAEQRHQLKNTPIDPEEIEKLVQAHATLYITPTNN
jgi:hypothetical protein